MTHYFYTNADTAYDYWYVDTVKTVVATNDKNQAHKPWRLVAVSDLDRFNNCQIPRYGSGLRQAFAPGSDAANYLGLPATVDAVA